LPELGTLDVVRTHGVSTLTPKRGPRQSVDEMRERAGKRGNVGLRKDGFPYWINERAEHVRLRKIPFGSKEYTEEYLQSLLHRSPDILPVEELDASFAPLISLGREIDGIDNLFISPLGRITIVETKLWRNPEATRQVVAQILEYATRVSSWSYEELERKCRNALPAGPVRSETTLYDHVRASSGDVSAEHEFVDAVSQTLRNGRFMLLVVGDGIHYGLENLLDALHTHPQKLFTFGLVELQVYENPTVPNGRLIVPQIVAHSVEIVRAVVRVETKGTAEVRVNMGGERESAKEPRSRRTLSEDEFFEKLPDDQARDAARAMLDGAVERGALLEFRQGSISVRLDDPKGSRQRFTLFVVTVAGELYTGWLPWQLRRAGLDPAIGREWVASLAELFPNVAVSPKDSGNLTRSLDAREVVGEYDVVMDLLEATIERIRASSGE